MVVFFVMLVLVVQVGFLVSTHAVVGAAIDATARRVSVDAESVQRQEARLIRDLEASVHGADIEAVSVGVEGASVVAVVRFRWQPPGPDLAPVAMTVRRQHVLVVPP